MKKILIRRKIEIIIIMIVSIVLGIVYSTKIKTPKYVSFSSLIIKQKEVSMHEKTIATYRELLKSSTTIKAIKSKISSDLTEEQLRKELNLKDMSGSEMIEISTTDSDSKKSYEINKEAANVFIQKVQEIYSIEEIHIIDEPEIPNNPSNINFTRDIIISLISGIIISFIITLLLEVFNKKVVSTNSVERKTKLNVIAKIPNCKSEEHINQSFRELKNSIRVINKSFNSFLITSTGQGEGRTWITSNLAISFARTGKKVLVIDVNLKRGKQYKFFEVSSKPGLSNYLLDRNKNIDANIINYIKETRMKNLCVLPAGETAVNSLELLISDNMVKLLEELKSIFDIVIIDGTSSSTIKDCLVISKYVQATIIVTEYEKTKIELLNKANRNLKSVGANVTGVIINKAYISRKKYIDSYFYHSPNGRREKKKGRHAVNVEKIEKEPKRIREIKHAKIKENNQKEDFYEKEAGELTVLERLKRDQENIRQEMKARQEEQEKEAKISEILEKSKIVKDSSKPKRQSKPASDNKKVEKTSKTRTTKAESEKKETKLKSTATTAKAKTTVPKTKTKKEKNEELLARKKQKQQEIKAEEVTKKRTTKNDNVRANQMLEQINEYLRIEREKNK